ncbi:MAG: hypothetical protein LBQ64_00475, partial [Bacteroidales bacterium]|jgi:hypothetical protein|nr:hypothetical protein [Bacteroidales bacterium]
MTNSKDFIYTTGALLRPQKLTDMFGNVIWMWAVAEFTDDSYKDDNVFNPPETALNLEELVKDENDRG